MIAYLTMENLPPEILEQIFVYTDPKSFIRLRKCCTKFKAIVDRLENSTAIWKRFLLSVYPVSSIACFTCAKCRKPGFDNIMCKSRFVQIQQFSFSPTSRLIWKQIPFYTLIRKEDTLILEFIQELRFSDSGLLQAIDKHDRVNIMCIEQHVKQEWPSMAYFDSLESNQVEVDQNFIQLRPISKSRDFKPSQFYCHVEECFFDIDHLKFNGMDYQNSHWCHFKTLYGRDETGRWKIFQIDHSQQENDKAFCRGIDFPYPKLDSLVLGKDWLAAVSRDHIQRYNGRYSDIYIISTKNFDENYNLDHVQSDMNADRIFSCVRIKMLVLKAMFIGNILVILCEDGRIRTTQIEFDSKKSKAIISTWSLLSTYDNDFDEIDFNPTTGCVNLNVPAHQQIRDFDCFGPILAAVSDIGVVYLTQMDVETRSLHCALTTFPLKLKVNGHARKISIGYCGGPTLAILERHHHNYTYISAVHVLYVAKSS